MAQSYPLILASTSPFRRALLARLTLPFKTVAPNVDETQTKDESPQEMVLRLAEAKAQAVANQFPQSLIIGSDQIAVLDHHIIGKPGNHVHAVDQLQRASGRSIEFLTSLCVLNTATGQRHLDVIPYTVVFRKLTDQEIEHYLRREQPYNCAGSFKSEGLGISLFEKQHGEDPTALIGLPLISLITMLRKEGIDVLS